jgi:hypothetical protein
MPTAPRTRTATTPNRCEGRDPRTGRPATSRVPHVVHVTSREGAGDRRPANEELTSGAPRSPLRAPDGTRHGRQLGKPSLELARLRPARCADRRAGTAPGHRDGGRGADGGGDEAGSSGVVPPRQSSGSSPASLEGRVSLKVGGSGSRYEVSAQGRVPGSTVTPLVDARARGRRQATVVPSPGPPAGRDGGRFVPRELRPHVLRLPAVSLHAPWFWVVSDAWRKAARPCARQTGQGATVRLNSPLPRRRPPQRAGRLILSRGEAVFLSRADLTGPSRLSGAPGRSPTVNRVGDGETSCSGRAVGGVGGQCTAFGGGWLGVSLPGARAAIPRAPHCRTARRRSRGGMRREHEARVRTAQRALPTVELSRRETAVRRRVGRSGVSRYVVDVIRQQEDPPFPNALSDGRDLRTSIGLCVWRPCECRPGRALAPRRSVDISTSIRAAQGDRSSWCAAGPCDRINRRRPPPPLRSRPAGSQFVVSSRAPGLGYTDTSRAAFRGRRERDWTRTHPVWTSCSRARGCRSGVRHGRSGARRGPRLTTPPSGTRPEGAGVRGRGYGSGRRKGIPDQPSREPWGCTTWCGHHKLV